MRAEFPPEEQDFHNDREETDEFTHQMNVKTPALLLCVMLLNSASAQPKNCDPKRGARATCDSIYQLCRMDAHYLSLTAVSKTTSPWYDSLYLPEELEIEYTKCLQSLYNDLPDSLADFRWHLQLVRAPAIQFHPDSTAKFSIAIPAHPMMDTKQSAATVTRRIDSLIASFGGKYLEQLESIWYVEWKRYECPSDINLSLVDRLLKQIHPSVYIENVPKYRPYRFWIDIDEEANRFAIRLREISACMPPELPCTYILRTFYYEPDNGCRYGKFERGVVPWPEPW